MESRSLLYPECSQKVRVDGVPMPTIAVFDQERAELDSVLSSGILERAPNLAHLLTYVCSKYFDGAGEQVKEYNIAVEALGRRPDFDQKKDSIVRVEAHKLRKRLREYYKTEGADHPIRIEIPPGQYAPRFIFQQAPAPDAAATVAAGWSPEAVLTQLARILKSDCFQPSGPCSLFLQYVVEHVGADSECLEERTVGVEVFARNPDYDVKQDPIVRTTAGKVRKRLERYYMEPAHARELRIALPVDSYMPKVQLPAVESAVESKAASPLLEPETLVAVAGSAPAKSTRRRWFLGIAAAGVLMLSVVVTFAFHRKSNLDLFWAPVTQQPGPVLICMGQPIAYNLLSAQAQDKLHRVARQAPLESPADEALARKDLVILPDRYVALGDAVCLVRLTALFEKYGKPYRIRGQRSTSFADLRENPAVLIAAFNNEWTLHAAGQLRFTFVKDSANDIDMVRDSQHPENTEWKLVGAWPYWDVANDYAIISRVRDVNSDRPVVIAAGITQYGTMAAGEFLTTSEYLSEAVSKLPDDWRKKNLQIVLRVPVVRGSPGRPRVLATHVW